ncbi:MAG: type I glutamate--ammonia ligase [Vampirovibrionales bacterium]
MMFSTCQTVQVADVNKATNRSVADILAIAKEQNVKHLRLQFVDIHGIPKHMSVHVNQLEKALNHEILLDGSSIAGFRSIETSDMAFYTDHSTFRVMPWTEGGRKVASIFCDIRNPDLTPFEGCPRGNLGRVVAEAEKEGFVLNVGPEVEFFLFKRDANHNITLETQDQGGYYDLAPDDEGELVRGEIVEMLDQLGLSMEADHHEVARGQHEIDFRFGRAVTAADNVILLKTVIRRVAAAHGLHASFMPKPVFGINGSGMHCNMSIATPEGGNRFFDPSDEIQLSHEARWFIGGLLKHVRGFTAISNPLVNSYKRLVPGYEAPVYLAWSPSNRSALIRVPATRGKGTRVELRSPDPSSNPYLTFAALFTAGLDGIRHQMEAPESTESNIYRLNEEERRALGIQALPGTLQEALEAYQGSEISQRALGSHIYNEFLKAKLREWDDYRTYVSGWEIDRYLAKY